MNNFLKSNDELVLELDNLRNDYDKLKTIYQNDISERKLSEEALRKSEEKYRLLIENSYDIIYTLSVDGKFLFISDAWEYMLGYDKYQFIGHSISELIHPDDLDLCNNWLKILIETGERQSGIEYRIKDKNGKWNWHSLNVVCVKDSNGNVIEIQGNAKDITKMKEDEMLIRKLSVAVEQSPATVVITDKNGKIEYANPRFSNLTGYTVEEVIGKNPNILNAGKTDKSYFKNLWDTILSGNIWKGNFVNLKKNGEEFIEQSTIAPIFNEKGEISYFMAIKEDVSSIHRANQILNEQNEQLNILINNIPVLVYFKDSNLKYIRINELFAHTLNKSVGEIIGKSDEELQTHNFEYHKNIDESVIKSNQPIMNIESIHESQKSELMWVSTSKVPYRNEKGDIVGIIGIVQDITYLKETEIKLKELNQSKDKFFSIIAHDLRNPLGSFMQITNMLYNEYDDFTEEERLEFIEVIKNSSYNLYSLLLNLLEWSRSQRGLITLNTGFHDFKSTVDSIVKLLSVSSDQKNITIKNNITETCIISYDENLMKTVIRNLLSNAIKFTPNGGNIEIGFIDQNNVNYYTVCIKDSGVGISQLMLENLFRIDSHNSMNGTNEEKGTGLGLVLCKEFVEIQGGKIWAESEPGKGSAFYFSINKISE